MNTYTLTVVTVRHYTVQAESADAVLDVWRKTPDSQDKPRGPLSRIGHLVTDERGRTVVAYTKKIRDFIQDEEVELEEEEVRQ